MTLLGQSSRCGSGSETENSGWAMLPPEVCRVSSSHHLAVLSALAGAVDACTAVIKAALPHKLHHGPRPVVDDEGTTPSIRCVAARPVQCVPKVGRARACRQRNHTTFALRKKFATRRGGGRGFVFAFICERMYARECMHACVCVCV